MKQILTSAFLIGAAAAASVHADAVPISVTGANADLIYDGSVGSATAFDTKNSYTFIDDTINFGGDIGTPGIPQTFVSASDDTVEFSLLGSYTENNALQLTGGTSGTLALTTPLTYSTIYVLSASANGGGTGTVDITFEGGIVLTLAFSSPDWYSGGTLGWETTGSRNIRVSTTTGTYYYANDGSNKAPWLYSYTLDIPEDYWNLSVMSLTFNMDVQSDSGYSTSIFGLSGVIVAVPEPSMSALCMVGLLAGVVILRRSRKQIILA